jgi:hypothetical protein
MDSKKYYWLKLKKDFYADDGAVDFLLSQPNGAEYVVLYQMLCLRTINTGGALGRQIGEVFVAWDVNKIVRDTKYFSFDTVAVAMELYKQLGLIYEQSDGVLKIAGLSEMVGAESGTPAAIKQRAYRERKKAETLENKGENATVTEGVTKRYAKCYEKRYLESESEIRERDKEIDNNISSQSVIYSEQGNASVTKTVTADAVTDRRTEIKNIIERLGLSLDYETIFAKIKNKRINNLERYLIQCDQEQKTAKPKATGFNNNFHQREYDFGKLEAELLKKQEENKQ